MRAAQRSGCAALEASGVAVRRWDGALRAGPWNADATALPPSSATDASHEAYKRLLVEVNAKADEVGVDHLWLVGEDAQPQDHALG